MAGVQNVACTKTETRCLILENHIYLAGGREDRLWTLDNGHTWVSSTGDTQDYLEREATCWQERGEGGGRGAESYDRKRAWPSINHSVLSCSTPPEKAGGFAICGLSGTPKVYGFAIWMTPCKNVCDRNESKNACELKKKFACPSLSAYRQMRLILEALNSIKFMFLIVVGRFKKIIQFLYIYSNFYYTCKNWRFTLYYSEYRTYVWNNQTYWPF